MDTYDVELQQAEGRFVGTVRAMSGLLVFGASVDEVRERAPRFPIAFRAGYGSVASRHAATHRTPAQITRFSSAVKRSSR